MDREPSQYSRALVLAGLLPLLLLDLAVGLPDGVFVGGSLLVLVAAGGVHLYGGEKRAAGGWVLFGVAFALIRLVDVTADTMYLVAFAALLVAGLLLLASEHVIDEPDS